MGKKTEAAKGVRETMKTSDLNPQATPVLRGVLKAKGGAKGGRAPDAGTATNRVDVLDRNMGARRVIDPNFNALPASNPESQGTQRNGRLIRSMPSRLGNFYGGRFDNPS